MGDHGQGSFKLGYQIVNVVNPNSARNTIPIVYFEAKDSSYNLELALGTFNVQLKEIAKSVWRYIIK